MNLDAKKELGLIGLVHYAVANPASVLPFVYNNTAFGWLIMLEFKKMQEVYGKMATPVLYDNKALRLFISSLALIVAEGEARAKSTDLATHDPHKLLQELNKKGWFDANQVSIEELIEYLKSMGIAVH
jgi:hypothetical protein